MNAAQTLILDLVPSQGSSVTACVRSFQLNRRFHLKTNSTQNYFRFAPGIEQHTEQSRALRPQRHGRRGHPAHPVGPRRGVDVRAACGDVCRRLTADIRRNSNWAAVSREEEAEE